MPFFTTARVEDVVRFTDNSDDLVVAVSLIRETFGPVDTPTMGMLLLQNFSWVHPSWVQARENLDKEADATLLKWRSSRIKREVNQSFARGDKPQ